MTQILQSGRIQNLTRILKRTKHKSAEHWSVIKKKIAPKDKALAHFNDFYSSVYGDTWPNIRSALMKKRTKYIAIVNNFSDTERTIEQLQLLGAMDLRDLYEAHRKNKDERDKRKLKEIDTTKNIYQLPHFKSTLEGKQRSEIKSLYPDDYEVPEQLLNNKELSIPADVDDLPELKKPLDPVQMRPLEADLNTAIHDENRIIKPSTGLTATTLYEYVPATKLKGLDDYVLESQHYGYYTEGADFSIKIEKETLLTIPEHLKIYTFESGNDSNFPSPKKGATNVSDYYLMDGGSILPILALDLQPGDTMLDMCAAPGGKSLAALQTMLPRVLVANDVKLSRVNRLNEVVEEYLGDLGLWEGRLFVTNQDGRDIDEKNIYNKILVDVPCTTDRHNLHNDDNNIFSPARIKERLQLPELQSQILLQALKIVAPGGTVVYSTCSLSPIQNDGVVQMALKQCWEETQSTMVVKDIQEALAPLSFVYKFGTEFGLKYGHLLLPTRNNNWGPLYFCKIMKVQ